MTGVWACYLEGSGNGEFPHADIRDLGEGFVGLIILKVEFDGFLEHGQGFLPGRPEAGYVKVQTLGDEIRAFAVESVVNLLHEGNLDQGLKLSSGERPAAIWRTILATVTRVPLMQGIPLMTLGSAVMQG